MSLRSRLLAELNRPWRKDPLPVSAFALAYTGVGVALVTIVEDRFEVRGRDGAPSFVIALDVDGLTLAALATALALRADFAGTVVAGMEAVLAVTLLDESDRVLGPVPIDFAIWTSPNWRVLEPARRLLAQAAARIPIALAQLNLLTAAEYFAERWGTYTTTTRRPPKHAPITAGLIRVATGATYVKSVSSAGYGAWRDAFGTEDPALYFQGATVTIGGTAALIGGYSRKGSVLSPDEDWLILAAPWPGASTVPNNGEAYVVTFPPETDAAYTARQLRELIRPRENNIAMAVAIEEDTGQRVVAVQDREPEVFRASWSRPSEHRIAGLRYNAATVAVVLDVEPTLAVIASAHLHAAAGVHVLVEGVMEIPFQESRLVIGEGVIQIGTIPAMQIGVTPIGGGKIGPP